MSEKNDEEKKVLTKDEKAIKVKETKLAKKEAKAEKKRNKPKRSPREIGIMIIIIIICIALGGTGLFTLIYSSTASKKNTKTFGVYDGESINLESGSILAEQYTNLSKQNSDSLSSGDTSAALSIWSQAYQNSVAIVAMNQMADEAKILTPEIAVDKAILKTGYYNDSDGNFSQEIYDSVENSQRIAIQNSVKANLPIEIVSTDVSSIICPIAEKQFIIDMADKTRSFRYAIIDYSQIPDEIAKQNGEKNSSLFKTVDLSVLTVADQDSATSVYDELQKGTIDWANAVKNNSLDNYKDSEGKVGEVAAWNLAQNLKQQSDLDIIFSTTTDNYTVPMEGVNGGWSLYKINTTPVDPDFTTETSLYQVKAYLAQNNPDILKKYVDDNATVINTALKADFDGAIATYNLPTVTVSKACNNYGSSSYMGGLSYTDKTGLLSQAAAADIELTKKLYTEDKDYITDAIKVNDSYIVAQVTDIVDDKSQGSMVSTFYDYYLSQQNAQDFYSVIYKSDKHENDFFQAFMQNILPSLQSEQSTV